MSVFNSRWFHLIGVFAPTILTLVIPGGAVLGPLVSAAISEAELIPGATGEAKKDHVLGVVVNGLTLLNKIAGKPVADATAVTLAIGSAIDTTIQIVNALHKAQEAGK